MSGQAAAMTRKEVCAKIKEVECHHGSPKGSGGANSHNVDHSSMKTTNKR